MLVAVFIVYAPFAQTQKNKEEMTRRSYDWHESNTLRIPYANACGRDGRLPFITVPLRADAQLRVLFLGLPVHL